MRHPIFLLLMMPGNGALTPQGLGIDLGTSGVRATVVRNGEIVGEAKTSWPDRAGPDTWLSALAETLRACPGASEATRIAVSGTSATLLAVRKGQISRGPMMYCDSVKNDEVLRLIERFAPEGHTTRSKTSALAKLLEWHLDRSFDADERCAHQADFVATAIANGFDEELGPAISSDWHNALKLGFDVEQIGWPQWMENLFREIGLSTECLMPVKKPGAPSAVVSKKAAEHWGLREGAVITGGTTDSIAAFLACSFRDGRLEIEPGSAVTSLGSTTAIKLVSDVKIDDSSRGVYSHRLDDVWLVGGASNAGCRVLRYFDFSDDELTDLSKDKTLFDDIEDDDDDVYPLCEKGERFPVNDPDLEPRLPRCETKHDDESDSEYTDRRRSLLRRLLVGITNVEATGYGALADLGATSLRSVATAGGGAQNDPWRRHRATVLNVPVVQAQHTDAAFGAAILALVEADASSSSSPS